jgi:hypothetical protein
MCCDTHSPVTLLLGRQPRVGSLGSPSVVAACKTLCPDPSLGPAVLLLSQAAVALLVKAQLACCSSQQQGWSAHTHAPVSHVRLKFLCSCPPCQRSSAVSVLDLRTPTAAQLHCCWHDMHAFMHLDSCFPCCVSAHGVLLLCCLYVSIV